MPQDQAGGLSTLPIMDVVEHLTAPRREGDLLAEAAARTDLETPIPTCPEWRLRDLVRHTGGADCTVRGPSSDLHLLLWNRRTPEGLEVDGDISLLDFWQETVQVRWSRSR